MRGPCQRSYPTTNSTRLIISVSDGVKANLQAYLDAQGVSIGASHAIHDTVPFEAISHSASAPPPVEIPGPFLVHVARLIPVKRQLLLLEAFALARQQGLKHRLVIIGNGSERAPLETCPKLGIDDAVDFLGHQANPYPWMATRMHWCSVPASKGSASY